MSDVCSNDGCTRPVRNMTFGLCKTCNTNRLNAGMECVVEDCTNTVKNRGLCSKHYVAWTRGQLEGIEVPAPKAQNQRRRPEKPERQFTYKRICNRWQCSKEATFGDFCGWHKGDDRFANSPVCREKECLRAATYLPNTGFCPEHGVSA